MSYFGLIIRSLRYYWRSNIAIVLCVAVGVAVLTGDLIVGDSIKGTLRTFAVERLGTTEYALFSRHFFSEELVKRLQDELCASSPTDRCVPAILLGGSAENASSGIAIPSVNLLAIRDDFWRLYPGAECISLDGRAVVINDALAGDLSVSVGDSIIVNIGKRGGISAGSLFGVKSRQAALFSTRLDVARVIPSRGAGAFALKSDVLKPRNIYISLDWLQKNIKETGNANLELVSSPRGMAEMDMLLARHCSLADYGLVMKANTDTGCVSVESRGLTIPDPIVEKIHTAATRCSMEASDVSVYLFNTLQIGDSSTPYSIVAGIGASFVTGTPLGSEDIILNEWLARDLDAHVGDAVEASYYVFDPQGNLLTKKTKFAVKEIVGMEGGAVDPLWTPEFKGITDAASMQDWNAPFPIDMGKIRKKDEDYWDRYRALPKAFISLEAARRLWGAVEAGQAWVTSARLSMKSPQDTLKGEDAFAKELLSEISPEEGGLMSLPLKQKALRAAEGSSEYSLLLLAMSMFIIASVGALITLLFRILSERRASQCGILLAMGYSVPQASGVIVAEGAVLAGLGACAGIPLSIFYAQCLMLYLRSHAISLPGSNSGFHLYVTSTSVISGVVFGVVLALVSMWFSIAKFKKAPILRLLGAWQYAVSVAELKKGRGGAFVTSIVCLLLAVCLVALSVIWKAIPAVAAFFMSGTLLLLGGSALFLVVLTASRRFSLAGISLRANARNRTRILLVTGMVASASFLAIAVSAYKQKFSDVDTAAKDSGAGGFNLLVKLSTPVHYDLNVAGNWKAMGVPSVSQENLADMRIEQFRLNDGEDISCLNVQKPTTPRVLGVPQRVIRGGGFACGSWDRLNEVLSDGAIPALGDANSLQWILHVNVGDEIVVPSPSSKPVRIRIVGALTGSIFASELLVSEENFLKCFGGDSGYQYLLVKTPLSKESEVTGMLRGKLGDWGVEAHKTSELLSAYAQVQNSYIVTFQLLSGLGLLLGIFGVGLLLLRNIIERGGELALMSAVGFTKGMLVRMIVVENGAMLLAGALIGGGAALVANIPYILSHGGFEFVIAVATLLAIIVVGLLFCALVAILSLRRDLIPALRSGE